MNTLNQKLFLYINSFAGKNHLVDLIMIIIAQITPYLFILLLFYFWFSKNKNEALYAGYAAIIGVLINKIIGLFYFHPRPFMNHLGTTLLSHKADSSFPSNHTTFTLSIAFMLLTFKSTRVIGVITTFFALWCGFARVYIGVHYPFDIFGSIIVSVLTIIIVMIFKNKLAILNKLIINIWHKILSS